jgi:hypothetical protein
MTRIHDAPASYIGDRASWCALSSYRRNIINQSTPEYNIRKANNATKNTARNATRGAPAWFKSDYASWCALTTREKKKLKEKIKPWKRPPRDQSAYNKIRDALPANKAKAAERHIRRRAAFNALPTERKTAIKTAKTIHRKSPAFIAQAKKSEDIRKKAYDALSPTCKAVIAKGKKIRRNLPETKSRVKAKTRKRYLKNKQKYKGLSPECRAVIDNAKKLYSSSDVFKARKKINDRTYRVKQAQKWWAGKGSGCSTK